MLARPSTGRIFVATQPTDLRKSYDGLSALVEGTFERDLTTGDMFVFINRRATQVRILYWDRDGFCIWMKRLEAGTFRRIEDERGHALIEVDTAELMMLLGGIEASVYDSGATLTGSFQFDLDGAGSMALSSQHRVDTGNVINMVDIGQGTWTNLDSDALSGGDDSIGGTLEVDVWNPSRGQAEITFTGVSLMNVGNGNVCTIDGTVVAEELYP